jgi:DNA-binding winged helix-turn-helix (wHTH) protein
MGSRSPQSPRDRLLEGEDPGSGAPQDARHWIAVYREMISFKDELLARIRGQLDGLPPAARQDVLENDIRLFEGQLERYQRRLEYWFARQWEIEGLQIDHDARAITYRDRTVLFSRRELQLVMMLASRSPAPVPSQQLLVQAWHDSRLPAETLRTYLGKVRAKLRDLEAGAVIENRPGQGYALVFEAAEEHGAHPPSRVRQLVRRQTKNPSRS